jgi:hypothetical protein
MFLLSRFGKKIFILLLVFIVFSTENTIYSFIKVRYNRDVVISNSTRKLYDPMASLTGIDDKYKTILCYSSKPIKYIQVLFPDFVCIDYEQRKDLPKENVIYIIGKDRSDKKVSRLFKKKKKWYLVSDIRSDKDVVYVTGKKLASTLRRQGHKLITYTRKKSKAL